MLQTLLESARPAARTPATTAASVLAHAALVGLATMATLRDEIGDRITELRQEVVYRVATAPRVESAQRPIARTSPFSHVIRQLTALRVPEVPRIDVGPAPVQSTFFATDLPGGQDPATDAPPGGIYTAGLVDRAVTPRADNPQPQFPAQMRAAGVEGSVFVRFVVDSAGRVEPRSITVVETNHALFGDAVRRWLARTRYAPAEVKGQPVRQLVEQRVEFALLR